jgi:acetoin utilization deacetylase AcuC-like enzyme
MYTAYSPIYAHPLPAGHRFPMEKYELLPQQLLHEGTLEPKDFHVPMEMAEEVILLTHDADYWQRLKSLQLTKTEIRRTGFPLSVELVLREITIAQGTLDGALHALEHGIAYNIAGGTHHAFSNAGEGFCLLNDQAIAANYLLHQGLAKQILIVDLDVHQGNGTAQIFQHQPQVFTFSMHGAKNFPHRKEVSDLDIALHDGITDGPYLQLLSDALPKLIAQVKPDFIFYLSGVDVLATDKLGRLGLTIEGCRQRDEIVLSTAHTLGIPVQVSMGGGYSADVWQIVEAHANTFRVAKSLWG